MISLSALRILAAQNGASALSPLSSLLTTQQPAFSPLSSLLTGQQQRTFAGNNRSGTRSSPPQKKKSNQFKPSHPVPKNQNNRIKYKQTNNRPSRPFDDRENDDNEDYIKGTGSSSGDKSVMMNNELVRHLKSKNINIVRLVEAENRRKKRLERKKSDSGEDDAESVIEEDEEEDDIEEEEDDDDSSTTEPVNKFKKSKTEPIKETLNAKTVSNMVPLTEAIRSAQKHKEDLVLVADANAKTGTPPVVKTINFGKMAHDKKKRVIESVSKTKKIAAKEFRVKCGIEDNDLKLKLNKMIQALCKQHPVKVSLTSKARYIEARGAGGDIYLDTQQKIIAPLKKYVAFEKQQGSGGRGKRHLGGLTFHMNPKKGLTKDDIKPVELYPETVIEE